MTRPFVTTRTDSSLERYADIRTTFRCRFVPPGSARIRLDPANRSVTSYLPHNQYMPRTS